MMQFWLGFVRFEYFFQMFPFIYTLNIYQESTMFQALDYVLEGINTHGYKGGIKWQVSALLTSTV